MSFQNLRAGRGLDPHTLAQGLEYDLAAVDQHLASDKDQIKSRWIPVSWHLSSEPHFQQSGGYQRKVECPSTSFS